jgi:hypothetical protein
MSLYNRITSPIVAATLILLLCFANLVGTTYALFTAQTKDGSIGVITTSGDVEVDIVDTAGGSLKGKVLQFVTTSTTPVLFEPGTVFYTQGFQVVNTGNIPVTFRIRVNLDGMSESDRMKFEQAFEFGITTDTTNRSDEMAQDEFVGRLSVDVDGQTAGSETYHLIIKMKETAGNDFQGAEYDGIGITVYAVQGNSIMGD